MKQLPFSSISNFVLPSSLISLIFLDFSVAIILLQFRSALNIAEKYRSWHDGGSNWRTRCFTRCSGCCDSMDKHIGIDGIAQLAQWLLHLTPTRLVLGVLMDLSPFLRFRGTIKIEMFRLEVGFVYRGDDFKNFISK